MNYRAIYYDLLDLKFRLKLNRNTMENFLLLQSVQTALIHMDELAGLNNTLKLTKHLTKDEIDKLA